MKQVFYPLLFLGFVAMIFSSCSQSQPLPGSKEDKAPSYRYHRVYEGNKIIFRDTRTQEIDKLNVDDESLALIEEDQELILPLENRYLSRKGKVDKSLTVSKDRSTPFFDIDALAKELGVRKTMGQENSEDAVESDDSGTLGLLGFIFSFLGLLLLFLIPIAGLIFVLLGFIFSLIGLGGPNRGLAIAGTVIGGIGLLIFIIALVAAAAIIASEA